jgi:hypothetical protein
MRTLFIGEDSSQHVNNFLWAYNIDTRRCRASCRFRRAENRPACMRWTNWNGWTYIMSNSSMPATGQHPQRRQGHARSAGQGQPQGQAYAAVGYLTCEPAQMKLSKA